MLFKSIDPIEIIRDVPLGTGINIVWGVEKDTSVDDNGADFEPGHGVGKTTFCRLIRYCFGEKVYGQQHAAKEIRATFPEGFVAIEVVIDGQPWSVLRPFDRHRPDSAQQGVAVEQLIANKPPRTSFTEYHEHLASVCLEGIRTERVLVGGASIEWEHLLAMCSRDQEARYQSLWNWRSPRSDSDWPAFKQPKVDALLCLRSVLGLLPEEETSLQVKLQALADEVSDLDDKIAERRREPEFWVRELRRQLQETWEIEGAENAPLDSGELFGLHHLVNARISELKGSSDTAASDLKPLERQISLAAAALQEPAELQAEEQTAADATSDGTTTLLATIRELEELKQSIEDAKFARCKYGQLPIGECSYAQEQLDKSEENLRKARQDQLPVAAEREQIAAALQERAQKKTEALQRLRAQLDDLHIQRNKLQNAVRKAARDIRNLEVTLKRLEEWDSLHAGRQADSELARLVSRKAECEADGENSKEQLRNLLATQNQRIVGIRQMFEELVKQTLSPKFHGKVNLSSDGLSFQIFRGENMSGEAFETLSILLADLAALLMGAYGNARHPGLLIHDSPREADLGGVIYRQLLSIALGIANALRGDAEVPFQYIVTTTTAPPTELRRKSITRLKLGGNEGQLFGQQLHSGSGTTQGELPLDGD